MAVVVAREAARVEVVALRSMASAFSGTTPARAPTMALSRALTVDARAEPALRSWKDFFFSAASILSSTAAASASMSRSTPRRAWSTWAMVCVTASAGSSDTTGCGASRLASRLPMRDARSSSPAAAGAGAGAPRSAAASSPDGAAASPTKAAGASTAAPRPARRLAPGSSSTSTTPLSRCFRADDGRELNGNWWDDPWDR